MKKPPHIKVWNEELKKALEIRYEQSRREASALIHTWRNGMEDLIKERRDIWVDSIGNVHGMPLSFKTQTVRDLCYAIVQGRQPVFPPGYQPMTADEARYWSEEQNPYHHDPFLKRMRKGGGSYAILMAFHFSQVKTLSRPEICRLGQHHCTEPMETNFLQGTTHAGISSLSTLVSHKLILTSRDNHHGSLYTLTRDGERFTEALMQKFMQSDRSGPDSSLATPQQPILNSDLPSSVAPHKEGGTKRTDRKEQDLIELMGWLNSAPRFAIKKFKIGPDRRRYLHDICDALITTIPGLQLRHRFPNFDEQQEKTMQVILEDLPAIDVTPSMVTKLLNETRPSPPAKRSLTDNKAMSKDVSQTNCSRKRATMTTAKPRSLSHARCDIDTSSDDEDVPIRKTTAKPSKKVSVILGKSLEGLWDSDDDEYERQSARPVISSSKKDRSTIMGRVESKQNETHEEGKFTPLQTLAQPSLTLAELLESSDDESQEKQTCKTKSAKPMEALSEWILRQKLLTAGESRQADIDEKTKRSALLPKVSGSQPSPAMTGLMARSEEESCEKQKLNIPGASTQALIERVSKVKASTQKELIILDASSDGDSCEERTEPLANPRIYDSKTEIKLLTLGKAPPTRVSMKRRKQDTEVIEIDDSDNDSFTPFQGSQRALVALPKQVCQEGVDDNVPTLIIFIDDRERNREATPRENRIELTRHVTTGPIHDVWPPSFPTAIVEEVELRHGDYAFEVGSNLNERKRLNLVVERKTIRDIVTRSVKGDHWKQLTKMWDVFRHVIILIEGDPKTAKVTPAYGHQSLEGRNPLMTIIENEESLYCFFGRAILSHQSSKFIQTKNEQGTHRAIGALGLMAVSLKSVREDFVNLGISSTKEQTPLFDQLVLAGVPWRLAQNVSMEFGSVTQLQSAYANCESESCRSALLCPVLMHTQLNGDPRTPEALSDFVYRAFVFQDSRSLNESATIVDKRRVNVSLSSSLVNLFPQPNDIAFFSLEEKEHKSPFPTIVMETVAGSLKSAKLIVHVIVGDEFVKRIQTSLLRYAGRFVDASKEVGAGIKSDCSSVPFRVIKDRMVLLLQGLSASLDSISRNPGHQQEIRAVTDLVIANLMLEHNVVVIQAMHKKQGQLATIVQQLSLACFHYHLLTEEKHTNNK